LKTNKPAPNFAAEFDFTFDYLHCRGRVPSLDRYDNANTSNEFGSQHAIQHADTVTDVEALHHGPSVTGGGRRQLEFVRRRPTLEF
jgi:hypothetical protein